MERFFDAFAAIPAEDAGPDAFRSIGATVGIEVLGPPLGAAAPRRADG